MRALPTLVLLAFVTAAPGQAADSTLFELSGQDASGQFGAAVAAVGDVDADGVDDLAVGAPAGSSGLGSARIVSGTTGTVVRSFKGSTPGGRFGQSLASADVTGDSRPDALVGAPDASASAQGTVTAFDSLSGQPVWALWGAGAGDRFGYALTGLRDVDGDGIEDVAIGAIGDDDGGPNAGSVRVVSGFDGATLYNVFGSQPDEQFGFSLCLLDDLDGDGAYEFAVGAPGLVSPSNPAPGSVHVLSGASGAVLFSVSGENASDAFGRALAGVGDLDGDGLGDLVVGAPRPLGDAPGYARAISSAGGATLLQVTGESGEMFGTSVARAGDVDGDGVEDFAVGSPRDGARGQNSGSVSVWNGESGAELTRTDGASAGALLGTSLAGGFDVNLDGQPDLALGAPETGLAGGNGHVLVESSSELALASDVHVLSIAGPLTQAFELDAGAAFAGVQFALLGSVSGNAPGTPIGGLTVPLNADRYFGLTLKLLPNGPLAPPEGTLDVDGRASASFSIPPAAPLAALVGITFHHAFVLHDGAGGVLFTSNAVPATITL